MDVFYLFQRGVHTYVAVISQRTVGRLKCHLKLNKVRSVPAWEGLLPVVAVVRRVAMIPERSKVEQVSHPTGTWHETHPARRANSDVSGTPSWFSIICLIAATNRSCAGSLIVMMFSRVTTARAGAAGSGSGDGVGSG